MIFGKFYYCYYAINRLICNLLYSLDAYTQNMLILFHQLLGKDFWNFVIIVFTHVDEELVDELEDNIDAVIEDQGKVIT